MVPTAVFVTVATKSSLKMRMSVRPVLIAQNLLPSPIMANDFH